MIPNHIEHAIAVVYLIVNRSNGKIYVGSAKDFHQRYLRHGSSARRGSAQFIHKAMRKYGFESFEFSVLEKVDDTAKLIEREQHWIDELKPFDPIGYNINPTAGSWEGAKHSDEAKAKLSVAKKGHKMPPQTKAAIMKANVGRTLSQEALDKMRAAQQKRIAEAPDSWATVSVVKIDKDTLKAIEIYGSVREAALSVGLSKEESSRISMACYGAHGHRSCNGFYWMHKDRYEKEGIQIRPRKTTNYTNIRPVIQLTLDGQSVRIWPSSHHAAQSLGCSSANIRKSAKRQFGTVYGFKWRFCEDEAIIQKIKEEFKSA